MAKLYFYYSAMNAGKSTVLLQSSHNYKERGMHTLLLKPAIDNRLDTTTIASRIGLSEEAVVFNLTEDLYILTLNLLKNSKIACVLVDEAQFMTKDQVMQLTEITDQLSIPVLTYGLRTDFRGELFTGSQFLLAWADELIELKTICHCGRKAIMNMRVNEQGKAITEGEQIFIGGNESYIATCRLHFKKGDGGTYSSLVNHV
ncbi:MAG: thymidine kinase [Legionella sp.]|nr:thymidine kinase [Legionella sp.]